MADYTPLTEDRFKELKKLVLEDIKDWIPENLMGPVWSFRNEVKGLTERQPCSCQSAGALWKSAIDDLRKWVSEKENG